MVSTLTVTREDLALFLKDLWKDSRYLEIVDQNGGKSIRRFADGHTTISEEYQFITQLREKVPFNVPQLNCVTDDFLAYEYIKGTRAFNLLMDLRALYRTEQDAVYKDLGLQLLDLLQQDLAAFQSAMEKDPAFASTQAVYPAREKLKDLYTVLTSIIPQTCSYGDIKADLERIADIYERGAVIPFRDATPKNVIIQFPALFQKHFISYQERLDAVRITCSSGELTRVLTRDNVFQIDFSGCGLLCPKNDDWIALQEHESSAWLRPVRKTIALEDQGGELSTRFVRFSRFAGRKLAYRLLNHTGYQIRFVHDNEAVYFLALSDICQYLHVLGIIADGRLSGVMTDLYRLSSFRPDKDYLQEMGPVQKKFTYYSDVFPN